MMIVDTNTVDRLSKPAETPPLPMVTVIMPVFNEERYIERSLGAVLAQDYPRDMMEVLVADGMSTDRTRQIIEQLQADHPHLQLIDNPQKIVATGLNATTERAQGDVIVRVDGHCEIAPDYVRRCVEHLIAEDVDGVGGPIETIGETPMAETIAAAMSSKFGVGGSPFRTCKERTMLVDTVAFPAYRRRTVERAGPYDEELVRNQDDEYNFRLRKLGGKILLAANVHSRYHSRASLKRLWRQYYQYGYWKVRVMQKHPLQMQPRQFIPACFVLAVMCSLIVGIFWKPGLWVAGGLLGMYGLAALAAAIAVGRKHSLRMTWQLPFVFPALHISYGLGFLRGLVAFWNRWGAAKNQQQPLAAKQGAA